MSFWNKFDKKIVGLAPMDGVSDEPFRYITAKYSRPDVIYTEFVNVDSLIHAPKLILEKLLYQKDQRPIVAQFFGNDPKLFEYATIIAIELGFDGIDINMGCPSKNVAERGAGAGLIKTPEIAQRIISSVKKTVENYSIDSKENLPDKIKGKLKATIKEFERLGTEVSINKDIAVSVKTRIGYYEDEIERWIPYLVESEPDCIAIHGRTFKQLYTGNANWEAIAKAAGLIKSKNKKIKVLGNGDILSYKEGIEKSETYNLDGVLIGRGSLGKPWLFNESQGLNPIKIEELFKIMLEHSDRHKLVLGQNILPLRKHLAWYIKSIEGASKLRSELVQVNHYDEIQNIFNKYLDKLPYTK